ncbi:MAG: adenylyltransferase/cytidyltransferase family protein [Candidatus Hydrothermarchaeales archaeon]
MKEILAAIWRLNFEAGGATKDNLVADLKGCDMKELESSLSQFKMEGLLKEGSDGFALTDKGRARIKVIVCGGVFDILHPGHIFILDKAKSLGDVLVVIVARDSTVEKRKRIPIVPEDQRLEMVGQLKPVDVAVLGYEGDPLKIIEEIRPDVIVLGPDQHHDEKMIKEGMKKRGIVVEVKRIEEYKKCELNSTKTILQRIIERNYPGSRGG